MPLVSLGPYEVLARLASGGAGHVFLVRRQDRPRLCCLKTLARERLTDPAYVNAFAEEAALSERLSHPACVRALESGHRGQVAFICMEYVLGETLGTLMRRSREQRRPLAPELVAAVAVQILAALRHAHELTDESGQPLGIIHRDVSPQNAMVGYDGQSRLLDLGVAKSAKGVDTQTGIVKGKAAYMSPEQITGRRLDLRSDLYSLAVVLFEALTAQRVHESVDAQQIAEDMHHKPQPRLSDHLAEAPLEWEATLDRALSLHPDRRYPSAAAMQRDLQSYLRQDNPETLKQLIVAHMDAHFGASMRQRLELLAELEQGAYNEERVLEVLRAHPVRRIDLIGDDPQLTVPAYDDPMVVDFMGQRAVVPTAEFAEADPTVTSTSPEMNRAPRSGIEDSDTRRDKIRPYEPISGDASVTVLEDEETDDGLDEFGQKTVADPQRAMSAPQISRPPPRRPASQPHELENHGPWEPDSDYNAELDRTRPAPRETTEEPALPSWSRSLAVLLLGLGLGLALGLLTLR